MSKCLPVTAVAALLASSAVSASPATAVCSKAPTAECPWVGRQIGQIEDYKDPPNHYRLTRQGKICRVSRLMYVMDGDEVRSCYSYDWVKVRLSDGRVWRVRGKEAVKFERENAGASEDDPPNRRLQVIWRELVRQLSRSHEPIGREGGIRGGGRLQFVLAGLGDGAAQVAAGRRRFAIEWRGGTRPYRVRLYRRGQSQPVLELKNIDDTRLLKSKAKVSFSPGRYEIVVSNRDGSEIKGCFSVVDPAKVPVPPSDLVPEWSSPAVKTIMTAYWIARQDTNRWAYEAYLQVAPLADKDTSAKDLLRLLGSGGP